jgi:hypothetical protein
MPGKIPVGPLIREHRLITRVIADLQLYLDRHAAPASIDPGYIDVVVTSSAPMPTTVTTGRGRASSSESWPRSRWILFWLKSWPSCCWSTRTPGG